MPRRYTCLMDAVSVSAAKDLMMLKPAAGQLLRVIEYHLTEENRETGEQLVLQVHVATTDGTGTAITPATHDRGDAAFSGTAAVNLTADTTPATNGILDRTSQDNRVGFHYPRNEHGWFLVGNDGGAGSESRLVFRLDAAPSVAHTLTLSVQIEVEG